MPPEQQQHPGQRGKPAVAKTTHGDPASDLEEPSWKGRSITAILNDERMLGASSPSRVSWRSWFAGDFHLLLKQEDRLTSESNFIMMINIIQTSGFVQTQIDDLATNGRYSVKSGFVVSISNSAMGFGNHFCVGVFDRVARTEPAGKALATVENSIGAPCDVRRGAGVYVPFPVTEQRGATPSARHS